MDYNDLFYFDATLISLSVNLLPYAISIGYTPQNVNLFWDKPVLCSVVARDAEGSPVYVKRYLEGYRLYINGKLHMRLDNSAQNVTLTKCKPGKTYEVSLVALTSTEAARREKKRVSRLLMENTC